MALCGWAVDGYPHLQRGLPAAYGCVIVPSCCLGQGRVLGMAHRGLPESSALGRRVRIRVVSRFSCIRCAGWDMRGGQEWLGHSATVGFVPACPPGVSRFRGNDSLAALRGRTVDDRFPALTARSCPPMLPLRSPAAGN